MDVLIILCGLTLLALFSPFIFILIHEGGHALMALLLGRYVNIFVVGNETGPRIEYESETLFVCLSFFPNEGGYIQFEGNDIRDTTAFFVFLAGPLASLLSLIGTFLLFDATNVQHVGEGLANIVIRLLMFVIISRSAWVAVNACFTHTKHNADMTVIFAYLISIRKGISVEESLSIAKDEKNSRIFNLYATAFFITLAISMYVLIP